MLTFITSNKYKFAEVKKLLPGLRQSTISLTEIQELDPHKIIRHKLQEALKYHPGPFIVEDTSLYLDCLNGLPGPLGKWFEEKLGFDGLYNLVTKLGNSKAVCSTIIGFAKNKDDMHFFEGTVRGNIVSPKGESTFGFNSVFQPVGSKKTFGQMSKVEKNKISMRGIAVELLKEYLGHN